MFKIALYWKERLAKEDSLYMILKNLLMVKKISIALLMIISTQSFTLGVNKLEVENSTKSGFTNTASSAEDITIETQPDTTWQIKMGRRSVEMEHNIQKNRSRVRMYLTPVDKFKGHWGGIELGFNKLFFCNAQNLSLQRLIHAS